MNMERDLKVKIEVWINGKRRKIIHDCCKIVEVEVNVVVAV